MALGAAAPGAAGGTKRPAATACADVTFALVSVNDAARRSHAPASEDGFCA
jgi:hypothetical protein